MAVTTTQPEQRESDERSPDRPPPRSLGTAAARNLSTTTKSIPQSQEISPRWLLRILPWVDVPGATYRVNRRLTYTVGDGRVDFTGTGSQIAVIGPELRELPALREFDDTATLDALAERFVQSEIEPGGVIVEAGEAADRLVLIAHGRVRTFRPGEFGESVELDILAGGDHLDDRMLIDPEATWPSTAEAVTRCTMLTLDRSEIDRLVTRSDPLATHLRQRAESVTPAHNRHGEAEVDVAAGHAGETRLPGTFVDYDLTPREYELSLAQTVLRIHTRVADLYNDPMDQVEQQLRLTIEVLRERQEYEVLNNPDFGLLHNADLRQRFHPRYGPPTPDDLDLLLSRRRKARYYLAHPRAIAAFGRECNARGLSPQTTQVDGRTVQSWRGVPLLPCNKIPIGPTNTTSIVVIRTGEDDRGVVGLRRTDLPDEYQPGVNVRFMGVDHRAILSYLVSTYYSAAVLVPDALGILEGVEIGASG